MPENWGLGGKVVNSEGGSYAVENIRFENVESPETVYNFQVEDYHTSSLTDAEKSTTFLDAELVLNNLNLIIERKIYNGV